MNIVMLVGRVGQDPEVREMQNGKSARFSLATNTYIKGEKKTTWHNVKVFDTKLAEVAESYVTKGSTIAVVGEIEVSNYTDREGAEKTAFNVVLGRFKGQLELLGGGKPKEQAASSDQPEDDIPF